MSRYKKIILNFLGLFFLIYGSFAMNYSVYSGYPSRILWVCYIGMVIIGLGALIRSSVLVVSQLYILIIPLIFWNIDFTYKIFTKKDLFGLTNYFFEDIFLAARIISLEHIFLVPVGLFILWLLNFKIKNALIVSILEIFLVYFLTKFFTDPIQNVNCVASSCLPFIPTDNYYFAYWFILGIGMIFTTWFVLSLLVKVLRNKIV